MSEADDSGPLFSGKVSLGNVITIALGFLALAAAWGSLQSDIRALAQRVDKGDRTDELTATNIQALRDAVTELRADQRAIRAETERQSRVLDRIEQLLTPKREPMK
jgi:hypothetical protein